MSFKGRNRSSDLFYSGCFCSCGRSFLNVNDANPLATGMVPASVYSYQVCGEWNPGGSRDWAGGNIQEAPQMMEQELLLKPWCCHGEGQGERKPPQGRGRAPCRQPNPPVPSSVT